MHLGLTKLNKFSFPTTVDGILDGCWLKSGCVGLVVWEQKHGLSTNLEAFSASSSNVSHHPTTAAGANLWSGGFLNALFFRRCFRRPDKAKAKTRRYSIPVFMYYESYFSGMTWMRLQSEFGPYSGFRWSGDGKFCVLFFLCKYGMRRSRVDGRFGLPEQDPKFGFQTKAWGSRHTKQPAPSSATVSCAPVNPINPLTPHLQQFRRG